MELGHFVYYCFHQSWNPMFVRLSSFPSFISMTWFMLTFCFSSDLRMDIAIILILLSFLWVRIEWQNFTEGGSPPWSCYMLRTIWFYVGQLDHVVRGKLVLRWNTISCIFHCELCLVCFYHLMIYKDLFIDTTLRQLRQVGKRYGSHVRLLL